MKKILPIILLFISLSAISQSLPNNDMESWDNYIIYEQPQSWNTPNPYTILLGGVSVSKTNDAFSGSHAAKLETIEIYNGQIVIPGILTLADFSVNILDSSFSINGGYYLQENVSKLTGWYKYSGVDGDSASLFMYNFKNNLLSGYDTIGAGYLFLQNADQWQPFTINMQNLYSAVPDTFNIIISSSSLLSVKKGSTLFIDSLTIHTNTGIIDLWNQSQPLKVFPNPAINIINFSANNLENGSVLTIYDNFGHKIAESEFNDFKLKFDVSNFVSGVYVYKLTKDNHVLNSGTFVKHN